MNEAAPQRLSGEHKTVGKEHLRASNSLWKLRFENMSRSSTLSAITQLLVSSNPRMII